MGYLAHKPPEATAVREFSLTELGDDDVWFKSDRSKSDGQSTDRTEGAQV